MTNDSTEYYEAMMDEYFYIYAAVDGEADEMWSSCDACRRPYGTVGFPDLVVPDDVWAQISPTGDEGGLLCPGCIIAALEEADIQCTATFRSGKLIGQTLVF